MSTKDFSNQSTKISVSFEDATGTIDYPFTNDYMFRAILQKNKRVLTALICSLLHFQISDVKSIEVTNPIELGESMDEKNFVLDIMVSFNNDTIINLEMQVANEYNWEERSLSYLCRSFDQLSTGEEYSAAKPAIHIGFLDFTPFEEYPEFYATYKLLNVKNHHVYSDKFVLSVVSLNQIELATEEDIAYRIDYWARLFKAKTWEELKMVAGKDEYLQEASEALYNLNSDDIARQKALARRDYYRMQNAKEHRIAELTAKNEEQASEITILKKLLEEHNIPLPAKLEEN